MTIKKILAIVGPTTTGKTNLGLFLASKFNGEIISADSRQVYKGLNIGTGKDLPKDSKFIEQNSKLKIKNHNHQIGYYSFGKIRVWMLDVLSPRMQYNVKDYYVQANLVIKDILMRKKLPIIVGGTGLYIKALLEGIPTLAIPVDLKLRRELEKLSKEKLKKKLSCLSPAFFSKLNSSDKENPRRLIRAIELASAKSSIKLKNKTVIQANKYKALKIGLNAPREILERKIFERLILRIDQGLIQEAKKLHKNGLSYKRMAELGLEYGIIAEYLKGKIDIENFIRKLNLKIRHYAKRQMTWFNKDKEIFWFDVTTQNWIEEVEKKVTKWYHSSNDKTY